MTSIFEVLYCRRPVLNYVCPPVCEVLFSGSGFPVIVLGDFSSLVSPGGVRFGGFGNFRLSWNEYPGAICYNVYRAETDDPDAPLVIILECTTDTDIPLPPGCYRVSAITPDGETALSPFVCYFVPPMLPPEVTTHPATDIAATEARLNGIINAIGQASTAQFEWGITLAYGNFTPLQNTGDTFNDVPYTDLITGLVPNALYHYRAIGSNGSGIGEGADMTFMTLGAGGDCGVESYRVAGFSSAAIAAMFPGAADSALPEWDGIFRLLDGDTQYQSNSSCFSISGKAISVVLSPSTPFNFQLAVACPSGWVGPFPPDGCKACLFGIESYTYIASDLVGITDGSTSILLANQTTGILGAYQVVTFSACGALIFGKNTFNVSGDDIAHTTFGATLLSVIPL